MPSLFRPDHEAFTCGCSLAFRVASIVEKSLTIYPSAITCTVRDWEACLAFYAFPELHLKTICSTYVIERIFEEVKKRSKTIAAVRNQGNYLLLFYTLVRSLRFRKLRMPGLHFGGFARPLREVTL